MNNLFRWPLILSFITPNGHLESLQYPEITEREKTMFRPIVVDHVTKLSENFKFPLQCVFLKIFGSWPTQDSGRSAKLYKFYSAIVIFLIFITCCAQSFFVFSKWGDLVIVTECGCTVFMGIHNLIRCLHLSWQRDTMRVIMEEFLEKIFVSK